MYFGIRPPPSGWLSDLECHNAWRKHTGDARYVKVARHGINLFDRLVVPTIWMLSFLRVRDGKRINIFTTMLIPPVSDQSEMAGQSQRKFRRLEISTVHCDFKSIVCFHTWPIRIRKQCFRCTKLARDKNINNQKLDEKLSSQTLERTTCKQIWRHAVTYLFSIWRTGRNPIENNVKSFLHRQIDIQFHIKNAFFQDIVVLNNLESQEIPSSQTCTREGKGNGQAGEKTKDTKGSVSNQPTHPKHLKTW